MTTTTVIGYQGQQPAGWHPLLEALQQRVALALKIWHDNVHKQVSQP